MAPLTASQRCHFSLWKARTASPLAGSSAALSLCSASSEHSKARGPQKFTAKTMVLLSKSSRNTIQRLWEFSGATRMELTFM